MLRFIYVFFVGLFIAVFVGTGIAVFYPSPKAPQAPTPMTVPEPAGTDHVQQNNYNQQIQAYQSQLAVYNRNVSIIAIVLAVITLVISLVFADQLGIIANGLLLGGIFTLLYGIGRGMASQDNQYRFLAAAVGLAVTLGLGYFKFGSKRGIGGHAN